MTVGELIESLQKCPEEYEVTVEVDVGFPTFLEMVGIDHEDETVCLFAHD